jgi:hypothetical protein
VRRRNAVGFAGNSREAQGLKHVANKFSDHQTAPFVGTVPVCRHAAAGACWRRRRRTRMQRVDFLRYLRGKLTGSGQKLRGPTRHRGAIHPIESETLLS